MTKADILTLSRLCIELAKIHGVLEALKDRSELEMRNRPRLLGDAEDYDRMSEQIALMEGASAALEDVYEGLRSALDS